ncbi:380_t:CDS:2 [Funneliformis geosporum]|nr:380_t:CDS:2 [Funneliformis geosporum]
MYNIKELLTREVNRYFRKKNYQKIKIKANTVSDSFNILSRLNGFEKQLEKRETLLKQKENNIKNTIDIQVNEKHKYLKYDYDALKDYLEGEYNKCMIDMKQMTYFLKHQLEDQHKLQANNIEKNSNFASLH